MWDGGKLTRREIANFPFGVRSPPVISELLNTVGRSESYNRYYRMLSRRELQLTQRITTAYVFLCDMSGTWLNDSRDCRAGRQFDYENCHGDSRFRSQWTDYPLAAWHGFNSLQRQAFFSSQHNMQSGSRVQPAGSGGKAARTWSTATRPIYSQG